MIPTTHDRPPQTVHDTPTCDTTIGVHVADLQTLGLPVGWRIDLTFHWPEANRWEGKDFVVYVE